MMAKSRVVHHMESFSAAAAGTAVPSTEADENLTEDDLLSFMDNTETDLQDKSSCVGELDAYLTDSNINSCLQFWQYNINKFPKLYQLHLKHHCIPATSAAMERCFSADGYIVNARRSRLTDQMLEDMLIAKCNKDFMQK